MLPSSPLAAAGAVAVVVVGSCRCSVVAVVAVVVSCSLQVLSLLSLLSSLAAQVQLLSPSLAAAGATVVAVGSCSCSRCCCCRHRWSGHEGGWTWVVNGRGQWTWVDVVEGDELAVSDVTGHGAGNPVTRAEGTGTPRVDKFKPGPLPERTLPVTSDAHGYRDPRGFTGTGVTGAGAGHQIFTRDVPVPVWAGDGSVTRSHHSDVSAFSTRRLQQRIPEGYG